MPFVPEQMRALHTRGVTFLLDVPRVANPLEVFDAMLGVARGFAAELGGTLVDDNRAAVFNHITSTQNRTGRTISYQRAEFFAFRDGKIAVYRSIMDSFDIAEQVLGHEIDITPTVQILKAPGLAPA